MIVGWFLVWIALGAIPANVTSLQDRRVSEVLAWTVAMWGGPITLTVWLGREVMTRRP